MKEDEARAWLAERFPAAAVSRLAHFAEIVTQETERQNLISPSTIPLIWSRHIVDSAQLLSFAPATAQHWVDIGTGAGFPGIVAAILFDGQVTMIEPRAKRAIFLRKTAEALGVSAIVHQARAETAPVKQANIISARAVATVDALFGMTAQYRSPETTYLLPRGRTGQDEIVKARGEWHGTFHVEQSVTDPTSIILIATGVRARCSASR
ncbi:16S rRNA m(7)G-527 methyltransferase [Sphingomonas palmae]|uniref:Ribosomal RNA small subunit methyltransferase G n=1 Tax=Sphingomonas palmae TaxID=1855283 RepID=A0A1H7S0J9_9SPHN|nr:16S rRNA (guanine(527)-N(7))-methyltransferase RsmG [Sphingomonas palmae]SEL65878.1 16S rRNA m(7)G-527 methyltransferase [Sphingomonas palmae]